jgi:hypothetical protein
MEKTGFIYIWYDKKHKRYYVGCHWGTEDDGYICSSSWMKQAYKHRPQDFKRRIIQRNILRENLLQEEFKWLSLIKDEELKVRYYNLSKKHFGHWSNNPQTRKSVGQKISEKQIGRPLTDEWKANISRANKGRPTHSWTEESREKMRQHNLGRKDSPERVKVRVDAIKAKGHKRKHVQCPVCLEWGAVNNMARWHFENCGKPRTISEETKQKIREARAKQIITNEHRATMKQAQLNRRNKERAQNNGRR